MNRQSFLRTTGLAAPLILGFSPFAIARRTFLQNLMLQDRYADRILVVIQLEGGNDTLNTIIPVNQYDILSQVRKNILIPEKRVLRLNDTNSFGFHPSLTGLQRLYNDKMLSVVHGVGYPDPNFSHFKGTDIKITAHCGNDNCRSGWVGRYLEKEYQNYPKGYPRNQNDGPPCIRVGDVSPKITWGSDFDLGIGFQNLSDFDNLAPDFPQVSLANSLGGQNVTDIQVILKQVKLYVPGISSAAGKKRNLSNLYPRPKKNKLADQLKLVASLIGGGLQCPIYIVNQGNYDTHGDQVVRTDTTTGLHAQLLSDLSEAIVAFEDDLDRMGMQDKVLGMTFSEFGRRIASNESHGTDHGTAEAVILFGSKLKERAFGTLPELPLKPTSTDNMPYSLDFRALYSSVMKGWFNVSEDKLKTIIPDAPAERLELFKS